MGSTPRALQYRVQDPLRSTVMPQHAVERFTVHIGGLTCAPDALRLERAIASIAGVIDVMVDSGHRGRLRYLGTGPDDVIGRISCDRGDPLRARCALTRWKDSEQVA